MAITTAQFIVCVDTERESLAEDAPGKSTTLAHRVRIIDPVTLGELGASEWLPRPDYRFSDAVSHAFHDFYVRGGLRNPIKHEDQVISYTRPESDDPHRC
jgi:hypothetical protein